MVSISSFPIHIENDLSFKNNQKYFLNLLFLIVEDVKRNLNFCVRRIKTSNLVLQSVRVD